MSETLVWHEGEKIVNEVFSDTETFKRQNNKAYVEGTIDGKFEFSHRRYGVSYFSNHVRVTRLSGTDDIVPIIVHEKLIQDYLNSSMNNKYVKVSGQLRTYNITGKDGRKHVFLFLYVKDISFEEFEEGKTRKENPNAVYLEGYVCKKPVIRRVNSGRIITDLLLSVQGEFEKSDYIHCMTWGEAAYYARRISVGEKVKIYGRFQSREYFKKFSPDSEEGEFRTTYEVSVRKISTY